jgi:hypothetical protein
MTLSTDDLERQLELLALAIYSDSLCDRAHDFLSLLTQHRLAEFVENRGEVK